MNRQELEFYLHQYLQLDKFKDYCPNGLQVEGAAEINKIIVGVTASQQLLDTAVVEKADTVLVHHGYFWKGEQPVVTGVKRQRLATLLKNNLNLLAYHLPLDAHHEIGNNIQLAKLFNIQEIEFLDGAYGHGIGCKGKLLREYSAEAFADLIATILHRKPQLIKGSNKPIKTIAWCTGAAQDYLPYVATLGVDAYLSGEISERTYYEAIELGINYFACGHHATERYGIKALGDHLAATFDLDVKFVDSNNPV